MEVVSEHYLYLLVFGIIKNISKNKKKRKGGGGGKRTKLEGWGDTKMIVSECTLLDCCDPSLNCFKCLTLRLFDMGHCDSY